MGCKGFFTTRTGYHDGGVCGQNVVMLPVVLKFESALGENGANASSYEKNCFIHIHVHANNKGADLPAQSDQRIFIP